MNKLYHQYTRNILLEGFEPDDYFNTIENLLLNNPTSIKEFYPVNREISIINDIDNINVNGVLIPSPQIDRTLGFILKLKYQENKINHDILMVAVSLYETSKHNQNLSTFIRKKIIEPSGLLNEYSFISGYKFYIVDYKYENTTFNVYNDDLILKVIL